MIPESESDSATRIGIKTWFVGTGMESGDLMLELESESESKFFGKHWNRNQNRNHGFW